MLIKFCNIQHPLIRISNDVPLSFEMMPQDLILVEGDNGAGKTTFFKILAGLQKKDKGHIEYGCALSYLGPAFGLKDTALAINYLQLMKGEKISNSDSLCPSLDPFQLFKKEVILPDREIETLSSGQKMQLRLTGIVMQKRPLWILDEPCRFLDSMAQEIFWCKLLKQHLADGGGALISIHHTSLPILTQDFKSCHTFFL